MGYCTHTPWTLYSEKNKRIFLKQKDVSQPVSCKVISIAIVIPPWDQEQAH